MDQYRYTGYGIRFAAHTTFSLSGGIFYQNLVIFVANKVHVCMLIKRK